MGNGRTDSEVRLKRWFCIIEIVARCSHPLTIRASEYHSGIYPKLVEDFCCIVEVVNGAKLERLLAFFSILLTL